MKVVLHDDAASLAARAWPFLLAAEAEHNLFFGLIHTLRVAPHLYPGGAWLATVEEDGAVVGVALQTPRFPVVASRMPPAAAELLAGARPAASGVTAHEAVAERFALASGRPWRVRMRQGIYDCAAVTPPPPAPGRARLATLADEEVVMELRRGFSEAVGDGRLDDGAAARFRAALAEGQIWLWDDGGAVCLTAAVGPTPNGIRIGAVYTPPESRRRGYASSLVAAVTEASLRAGRRFCFLYTDLANPTSNAIYQRIGYRPVCDVIDLRFT